MGRALRRRLPSRATMHRVFGSTGGAVLSLLLCAPAPVAAQDDRLPTLAADPGQSCHVFVMEAGDAGAGDLMASCGERAVRLGPASQFETITSEALGATLVDIRDGDARRILLLTIGDDGRPLVEDLNGQIALAAGGGPMSAIDGIELDLKSFARSGEIGVRASAEDSLAEPGGRINLGPQVALERARHGERAVGSTAEVRN